MFFELIGGGLTKWWGTDEGHILMGKGGKERKKKKKGNKTDSLNAEEWGNKVEIHNSN